jgi:hypothetical protein
VAGFGISGVESSGLKGTRNTRSGFEIFAKTFCI